MPRLEQGVPRYDSRTDTIYIPIKEDWYRYYEPGEATAHEIGHWAMGHRSTKGLDDYEILQHELEATLWAGRKRGLTEEDKEQLYVLRDEARQLGINSKDFARMVKRAAKAVELERE